MRRRILLVIGAPILLLVIVLIIVVVYAIANIDFYHAKYSGPLAPDRPVAFPSPATATLQTLDHTCGYRSLEAVYNAYGLSPERTNLRFRLGVDQPAIPPFTSTRGTLHPDMFRVLAQDGFEYRTLDPQDPATRFVLSDHLVDDIALALIVREQTGGLHWIVIDRNGPMAMGETFLVLDPLDPEPRGVPWDEIFTPRLVSLVLISSADQPSTATISELHAAGLKEMARVRERVSRIAD